MQPKGKRVDKAGRASLRLTILFHNLPMNLFLDRDYVSLLLYSFPLQPLPAMGARHRMWGPRVSPESHSMGLPGEDKGPEKGSDLPMGPWLALTGISQGQNPGSLTHVGECGVGGGVLIALCHSRAYLGGPVYVWAVHRIQETTNVQPTPCTLPCSACCFSTHR